jgi:hypothetical protein
MIQTILDKIKSMFITTTYGSELDSYIQSRNPQNLCDIERFTEEFERRRFLQGDAKL